MAIFRRHWKLTVLNLTAVLCAILTFLWLHPGHDLGRALAQEAPATQPSSVPPTDPVLYSRVKQLQAAVCLTTDDLAHMQCSADASKAIVGAMLGWCQDHATDLQSAEQAKAAAESALAETRRRINVGPRDETLIASIQDLRSQAATARQAYKTLIDSAASYAATSLSDNQKTLWQVARSNVANGVPPAWKFTSGISTEQAKQLRRLVARSRPSDGLDPVVMASTAGLPTPTAIAATSDDALSAEREVLPPPQFGTSVSH